MLMRRTCVGALVHDLANPGARCYYEPHLPIVKKVSCVFRGLLRVLAPGVKIIGGTPARGLQAASAAPKLASPTRIGGDLSPRIGSVV